MARTISWQSRLSEMHRRVTESSRSPYHRQDIERLFDVQTPTAKKLIALMGRTAIGNSLVVERQDLLEFLGNAIDAEDLPAYLEQLRKNPPCVSRRKVRMAIPREFQEGNLTTLSRTRVWLERGRLEINFTTLDDLTSKLHQLMHVLPDPAFERKYCERAVAPAPTPEELLQAADMKRMQAEAKALQKIEAIRRTMELYAQGKELPDLSPEELRRLDRDVVNDIASRLGSEVLEHSLLGVAELLHTEACQLLDELGPDSADVSANARAALASLFPTMLGPSLQTSWPASNSQLEAVPSPLPAHGDRFGL